MRETTSNHHSNRNTYYGPSEFGPTKKKKTHKNELTFDVSPGGIRRTSEKTQCLSLLNRKRRFPGVAVPGRRTYHPGWRRALRMPTMIGYHFPEYDYRSLPLWVVLRLNQHYASFFILFPSICWSSFQVNLGWYLNIWKFAMYIYIYI